MAREHRYLTQKEFTSAFALHQGHENKPPALDRYPRSDLLLSVFPAIDAGQWACIKDPTTLVKHAIRKACGPL